MIDEPAWSVNLKLTTDRNWERVLDVAGTVLHAFRTQSSRAEKGD